MSLFSRNSKARTKNKTGARCLYYCTCGNGHMFNNYWQGHLVRGRAGMFIADLQNDILKAVP